MGWTVETTRPVIDAIFKELKMQYKMKREITPSGASVQITYESDSVLDVPTMRKIVEQFPEFVYIDFLQMSFMNPNFGDSFKAQ